MRFSIAPTLVTLQNGRRRWDLEGFVEECRAGDELGFYMAWNGSRRAHGEFSGRHGGCNNAMLASQYGLAHTERIRFGVGLVILPIHHPIEVIQDARIVNEFYPGRFRLAVGAGYTQDDFDTMGVPIRERGRRMEIGLEAINAYREGRPYELNGPWKGIVPPPDEAMTAPPLEVFAGAWSEPGVRRAARLADGWISGPIRTVAWEKQFAAMYREECAKVGKKPYIALLREACLASTDEEAQEKLGRYILDYHRIYMARGGTYYDPEFDPWMNDIKGPEDLRLEHILPDRCLVGSPETWIETLTSWEKELNPDEIIVRLRYFHGPELGVALESMKLIGKEIIPLFDRS